ncbi:hypothetical protein KO317_01260 [Candidatus Micrarchaeota archaeon]|nr:hypothetical protein [Candidatus Micrarchaeota archaeon]
MFISQLQLKDQELEELTAHTIMGNRKEIEDTMLKWSIENRSIINRERFEWISGGNSGLLDLSNEHLEKHPELKEELERRMKTYVNSRFMGVYDSMKKYGVLDYVAGLETIKDKEYAFIVVYSKGNEGLKELGEYKKQGISTFQKSSKLEEYVPTIVQRDINISESTYTKRDYYKTHTPVEKRSMGQYISQNKEASLIKESNSFLNTFDLYSLFNEEEMIGILNIEMRLNLENHIFDVGNDELILHKEGDVIKIKKEETGLKITITNNDNNSINHFIPKPSEGDTIFFTIEGVGTFIIYSDLTFEISNAAAHINMEQNRFYDEQGELRSETSFGDIIITEIPGEGSDISEYIKVSSNNIILSDGGRGKISFDVDVVENDEVLTLISEILKNNELNTLTQIKNIFNSPDIKIRNLDLDLVFPIEGNEFTINLKNAGREIIETEDNLRKITINGILNISYLGIEINNLDLFIESSKPIQKSGKGERVMGEEGKGTHIYSKNGGIDIYFGPELEWTDILKNKYLIINSLSNKTFKGEIHFDKIMTVLKEGEEKAIFGELYKLFPNGIKTDGTEIKLLFDILERKESISKLQKLSFFENINIQEIIDKIAREFSQTMAYSIKTYAPRNELFGDKGIWRGGIGAVDYSSKGINVTGEILNLNLNYGRNFSAHVGTSFYKLDLNYNPINAVNLSISKHSFGISPYIFIESSPRIGNFEMNNLLFGSYNVLDTEKLLKGSKTLRVDVNVADKKILSNIKSISNRLIGVYGETNISYNFKDDLKLGVGIEISPTFNYVEEEYAIRLDPYITTTLPYDSELKLTWYGGNEYNLSLMHSHNLNTYGNLDLTTGTNSLVANTNLYFNTGNNFTSFKFRINLQTGIKQRIGSFSGNLGVSSGPLSINLGLNQLGEWDFGVGFDVFSIINHLTPN